MTRLFVTATGTDIGKTFVTAMLAHQAWRSKRSIKILKPITSGFNEHDPSGSDPAILLESIGRTADAEAIDEISPWRFSAPIAPNMAAEKENRDVPFGQVVDHCREALLGPEDLVLIEGVGGVMAPVDSLHTVLDWIVALGVPTLLVAGTYVGTINHTLTALGVLRNAGVRVPAIVLSETPDAIVSPAEQAKAIAGFSGGVPVHILPRASGDKGWAESPCKGLCSLLGSA